MSTKVILSFCICLFVVSLTDAKSNKKITLTWDELESCPDFNNQNVDLSEVSIYMANETAIRLKGIMDVKTDLNKPIRVLAVIEKSLGNGNYISMMSYNAELCEKLETKNDWNPYISKLQPVPKKCPLPKRKYDVSKIEPQTNDFELNKDMIGSYKSTIKMHQAAKSAAGLPEPVTLWACYQLNFNVDYAE